MEIRSTGSQPIPFGKQGEAPTPDQIYANVLTQFSLLLASYEGGGQPNPAEMQSLIKQLQSIPSSDPNYQKVQGLITDLQTAAADGPNSSLIQAYVDILDFTRNDPGAMAIIKASPQLMQEVAYGQAGLALAIINNYEYPSAPFPQSEITQILNVLQDLPAWLGSACTPAISQLIQQTIQDVTSNSNGYQILGDLTSLVQAIGTNMPPPS